MLKTLVVYSGKYGTTEEIAKIISLIAGPARYCTVDNFKEEYRDFDFVVLGAPIYEEKLEQTMVEFVKQNSAWLNNKAVAVYCTCLDTNGGLRELNNLAFENQINFLNLKALGGRLILDKLDSDDKVAIKDFLELVKLPNEDIDFYNKAEVIKFALKLKELKEELLEKLDDEKLLVMVEEFISSHNTCCLATCHDGTVRSTPIEYNYRNKNLYLLSEGGEKFSNLLLNNNVSVSIYDSFEGMNSLAGMQITGKAIIIPETCDEYGEVIEMKGLNLESLKKLPVNINLIKIQVGRVEFLYSKFKEMNVDTKQIVNY
ncbi:MAG: pyridoxamine 5'-phosphate oxidase family protein [Methanobacterium sp. ERen5]|nr:MAG: pyridoxamine 5'-phosphate oxidase family protein [Methanobacterium sp. ERen5]